MTSPNQAKPVRIAIIGTVEPTPDGPLTRSSALAISLANHSHVSVTLRAIAPDEATYATIVETLTAQGDTITAQITIRPDGDPAPIRLGDTLDIWGLFAHDIVILDTDDAPLRAWLTDLPAHTAPGVRILGTFDYVTESLLSREQEIALRFDAIVGTAEQARSLFGLQSACDTATATAASIGAMMRGANLRTAAIHDGSTLAIAALGDPVTTLPLPTDISREAIIAAVAIAMARRASWDSVSDLLQP